MNLSNISFFTTIAVLFGIIAISSCSKTEKFAGQWQGTPERIMSIRGASDASATISIDFAPSLEGKGTGSVMLSAVIEVEHTLDHLEGFDATYQSAVTANASITGSYTTKDDDDVVIALDPTSLKVLVDPGAITFSQNILTGLQQPQVDSLSHAMADQIRVAVTPAIRDIFARYHRIEDIKVHHTDIMSCEIEDRDYTFRRVGVPE